MKRADLIEQEKVMMAEVVKRRALGGYSVDAAGILLLDEAVMRIVGHLIENYSLMVELAEATAGEPPKKKPAKKPRK